MYIQAAGLVYHGRTGYGVYHHAPACISLRLDDIPQQIADMSTEFAIQMFAESVGAEMCAFSSMSWSVDDFANEILTLNP